MAKLLVVGGYFGYDCWVINPATEKFVLVGNSVNSPQEAEEQARKFLDSGDFLIMRANGEENVVFVSSQETHNKWDQIIKPFEGSFDDACWEAARLQEESNNKKK